MFTNEEAFIVQEIETLLKGLGADTTRLKKLQKLSIDYDKLSTEEKAKVEEKVV